MILFFKNTPKSYENTLNTYKNIDSEHARIELRTVTSCNQIDWLVEQHTHPHLVSIISVRSRRFLASEWSEDTRYFIRSAKHNDEDQCRIRQGYADQNMAILRYISSNLLTPDKDNMVGIKIKRKMAGWRNNYLLKLLQIFYMRLLGR